MGNDKLIIMIPFAGGSSYSLKGLSDKLNNVDVLSLELPGRGRRIKESLLTNIDDILIDQIFIVNEKIANYKEYYIYGHSMGALLGYLLIHKILDGGGCLPKHFFVSGRGGPSNVQKEHKNHLLPPDEFREKLKEIGGSPDEVLEDEELMNFFEPILRADFKVIETYQHQMNGSINVPITCMFGSDEEVTYEEMQLWQKETNYPINIIEFHGNHFFIFNNWKEIAITVNKVLKAVSYFGESKALTND